MVEGKPFGKDQWDQKKTGKDEDYVFKVQSDKVQKGGLKGGLKKRSFRFKNYFDCKRRRRRLF